LSDQPNFWKDDPGSQLKSISSNSKYSFIFKIQGYVFILTIVLGIAGIMMILLDPIVAWVFLGIVAYALVMYYVGKAKRKSLEQEIEEVQESAKKLMGASHIGSAIHVAGCPSLNRDQPVVVALVGDMLKFSSYENPTPIETIPIDKVKSVHTVIYDGERIPHLTTIDSTAQALILSYERHGETWECLFRRMRKLKPIDWYQIIQKVRSENARRKG